MSDLDFMLHILSNLLSRYDIIVDMCQKDLRQETLTIKSLSQDLMSKFKRMNKDEDDTALAASEGGRYRKYINRSEKAGECKNCDKKGHTSDECHSLPKNANKKAAWKKKLDDKLKAIKCHKCGKFGHYKRFCKETNGANTETGESGNVCTESEFDDDR